jgi:hypothetical protein
VRYALAAVLLVTISCGSGQTGKPASKAPASAPAGPPVRITEFYAVKTRVTRGEKTLLCYGLENAKSVRLAPPVADVWPAMSRCVDISPRETTTYTLTAEDAQGRSSSRTARVEVGGPGPKILEVTVNKLSVSPGELVTVCYQARNATDAAITPGEFPRPPDPNRGCFSDRPRRTTTYRVKVTGPGGQADTRNVTVTVR